MWGSWTIALQNLMSFLFFTGNIDQVSLGERVEQLSQAIQQAFQLIGELSRRVEDLTNTNDQLSKALCQNHREKDILTNPSYDDMIIDRLFSRKHYQFRLELKEPMKRPLYRDRNFNLHISLVDDSLKIVPNGSRIQLKFTLYTSAETPEPVEKNRQGQPIMKGNLVTDLINGAAQFQKLSIREVSSKFEKGIFYILISVHASPFENLEGAFPSIRPLIIRDVIVKAKKI